MLGVPRTVIWDTLRSHAANYVQTITPVWIGMILLLLVWPLVVDRNSSGVRAWLPYGVAALVLTGMGVGLRCVFR
jgi:hypothetical protein